MAVVNTASWRARTGLADHRLDVLRRPERTEPLPGMTGPRRLAEGWSHRAVGKGPRCFPRQGGSEKIAAWSGERSESPVDRPGRTAHTRTPGRRFPAASSPASGTAMPVAEQARRMPEDRQDYAVSRSIAARTWRFRHATYEPPRGSTAQVLRLRRARRRSARSVWRQRRQQGHAAPHRRRARRSQFAATGQPGRCPGPAPFAGPLGSARIQAPASGKRREPTGNNGQSVEPSGPPPYRPAARRLAFPLVSGYLLSASAA